MYQPADIQRFNEELRDKSPREIIRWSRELGLRVFASTSFAPNSAGLLHLIHEEAPDIPVVWVDSGYNMPDAYRTADRIMQRLPLDYRVYIPAMTAERRNALMGGIPHPDDDEELHSQFTYQVKLEPFQRAIDELQGQVWITGIRRGETDFRKTLDIVSLDSRGLLRVAPIFYWSDGELESYVAEHDLPSCRHYLDPTKVFDGRECGLHTSA